MDLEPASKSLAAHRDNFALCREIITDDRGDDGDTCASADGSSCCGAFPDGRRVCDVRGKGFIVRGSDVVVVSFKSHSGCVVLLEKLILRWACGGFPWGKSKRLCRKQR